MNQTVLGIGVKTLSKRLQMTKQAVGSNSDIKRTCRQCGTVITAKWRKAYCSQECSVVDKRKRSRKWRADNLEKAREINRRSEERRREKAMAASGVIKRACRQCGKVITAKWRRAYCSQECGVIGNRERSNEWRADNLEKSRETARRWYRNNPEKAMESSRLWQHNNPEKAKEKARRHYAKRRKVIKENTKRWVENYLAKVREGARMEREAEGESTGYGRPHKAIGGMQMEAETV